MSQNQATIFSFALLNHHFAMTYRNKMQTQHYKDNEKQLFKVQAVSTCSITALSMCSTKQQ